MIAGAVLVLMPMLAGRAGAEVPGCDWTNLAFWKGAEPARVAAIMRLGGANCAFLVVRYTCASCFGPIIANTPTCRGN